MKMLSIAAIAALSSLGLVSCDKAIDPDLQDKLSKLEKTASDAQERQRQLETELAEQQMAAEREAIERERTLIDDQRIAMEEDQNAQSEAAASELAKRQLELEEERG